jgi:general secretion pathway protein D
MIRRNGLIVVAMLLVAMGRVTAQEPEVLVVNFDFQGADLQVVISALAEAAGINIVHGELPARPITLRINRAVPVSELRRILESVVQANGLELVEDNGLLRIVVVPSPVEEAEAAGEPGVAGSSGAQERRLFVHHLRHARASTVVQTLRQLFRLEGGSFQSEGSGSQSLSEALRQQRQGLYQEVDRLRSGDVGAQGQGAGGGGQQGVAVGLQQAVDIVEDPMSGAILILATPADYDIILGAIQAIDTRPLQVLIEVLIAEVRRNRNFDLGIDVHIPLQEGDDPQVGFSLTGLSAGDVAMQILGIGNFDADVVLRALSAVGDVTILSRPVLLAQNNTEARIMVGDQRPFIQMFRSLPTDAAVRDQVVQYQSVGTKLTIRPSINADGYINLSVQQEVSTATSEIQFGAPVINTREVSTELLVKDGQTVVLGGLIDHQRQKTYSGVPFLQDIPLLGFLFRSTREQTIQNELLLLVTTHVIHTDDELEETTRLLRESMEEMNKRLPHPIPLFEGFSTPRDSIRLPVRPDTIPVTVPDTIPRPKNRGVPPDSIAELRVPELLER